MSSKKYVPVGAPSTYLDFYKGFTICSTKKSMVAEYKFLYSNYHVPRSFEFFDRHNKSGIQDYIDACIFRDLLRMRQYENNGIVGHVVYEDPPSNVPLVRVSIDRLMCLLRGEDVLEIPATSRVMVCETSENDGNVYRRIVPDALMADILDEKIMPIYISRLREMVGNGRPIMYMHGKLPNLKKSVYPGTTNSSNEEAIRANLKIYGLDFSGLKETEMPPEPIEEVLISSVQKDRHVESITLISGHGPTPYYVKNLLRGTNLLWQGTSYSVKGPWRECSRDVSRLAALGIEP